MLIACKKLTFYKLNTKTFGMTKVIAIVTVTNEQGILQR